MNVLTLSATVSSDIKLKDVVISEIMWGIDDNADFAARTNLQYIELYNTVADADADADH